MEMLDRNWDQRNDERCPMCGQRLRRGSRRRYPTGWLACGAMLVLGIACV